MFRIRIILMRIWIRDHDFFWYPDPDQRFLMRIRIRPNDTDPTGSGSETLEENTMCDYFNYLFLPDNELLAIRSANNLVLKPESFSTIDKTFSQQNRILKSYFF